ncbi:2Fe-2S iron-sulfur cluster binding domain-containing protein [Paenibacillus sp. IB182496]|uniref:2Fe-2S iron-sulfur cluster binding domain-containing protein n=1 Tax=Paenibacillus sabuli TaxID=2772509 RepID=A0A927BS69_9BACL|nr:2Fe-2S iron-sulfur cluster binding domain-containing protein [Paenibacillus sabuli]MBD2844941.1 2Fe-2S iron-sulfur cluster binding domain-containing protein [Paenibacillus sabuli]
MPTVTYQTSGKVIEVPDDANLLRTSIRHEGDVPFKCGGGLCGTCKVRIVEGGQHLSKIMKKEVARLGQDKLDEGYRLACQTFVGGDVTIAWGEEDLGRLNKIAQRRIDAASR